MAELAPEEAYLKVLELLRSHDLGWVAAQVQDQVRAGRPVTRVVSPRPVNVPDRFAAESSQPPRRRRERLAATEPYSAEERLQLVLDAIDRAVIQTADMEQEVLKFFNVERQTAARVAFEPEQFEDASSLELGPLTVTRSEALGRLRQVVTTMRGELGVHANQRHPIQ